MVRALALLLCLTLPTAGCALRGSGSGLAYTIDTSMVVIGGAQYLKAQSETCEPGYFGLGCVENDVDKAIGLFIFAAGFLGIVANAYINRNVAEEPAQPVMTVNGPPGGGAPSAPAMAPEFCGPAVRAWEQEDDPIVRAKRYQALPAPCRAMLSTRLPAGR